MNVLVSFLHAFLSLPVPLPRPSFLLSTRFRISFPPAFSPSCRTHHSDPSAGAVLIRAPAALPAAGHHGVQAALRAHQLLPLFSYGHLPRFLLLGITACKLLSALISCCLSVPTTLPPFPPLPFPFPQSDPSVGAFLLRASAALPTAGHHGVQAALRAHQLLHRAATGA
ncbi:unnamed protein product [Closterium sp. Naga37s-1]|nr:unnamed protein product [Closterium sp. Naga37s-1]